MLQDYSVGFLGAQDELVPPSSWGRAERVGYPTILASPGAGALYAGCWQAVPRSSLLCPVAVPAGEQAVAPQADAEKELSSYLPSADKLSLSKPRKELGLPHPCFGDMFSTLRLSHEVHCQLSSRLPLVRNPMMQCPTPTLHGWFLLLQLSRLLDCKSVFISSIIHTGDWV